MKKYIIPLLIFCLIAATPAQIRANIPQFVQKSISDSLGGVRFNSMASRYGVRYCGNAVVMYDSRGGIREFIRDREFGSDTVVLNQGMLAFERRLKMMKASYDRSSAGMLTVFHVYGDSYESILSFDSVTGALMYARVCQQ